MGWPPTYVPAEPMVLQALLRAGEWGPAPGAASPQAGALAKSWGRGGDAELALELGWDRQ